MQNGHMHTHTECLECELPTQERLHFFTGQFLTERDFSTEQSYHIGKHRHHNRYLHGWGTVCGLRVVPHPDPACRDRFVIIEPGLALDCYGREIVVREKVYVDLVQHLAPTTGTSSEQDRHLLFSLCYAECQTEFVPALYSECGCNENGCMASRMYEGFTVKVERLAQLPKASHVEPVGVHLAWTTTINLDKALRLALDPNGDRLYVLTAADQGQIMVYDTNNHCLLRSIDLEARGVDLAISPTGRFLYVVRHVAGTPGEYFMRVIDVQDLNAPGTVNDLPLSAGPPTNPPKIVVAAADGRVYTLDPNASPKKVIIWKTTINTSGVDPTLPLSDPNAPKYAEVITGDTPHDIAVSPDGKWLFIAEGPDATDASNRIKAAKVETLTSTPVIHTIPMAETPVLLAVSGDSLRLYVVTIPATGNKKVRALRIQETPSPFPEIGIGVDGGPDEPLAITASPSGKWAYLLVRDASGKGWVRVVNGGKFETDPAQAVAAPVAVVSSPQDMLLDREGRRLYAAGEGSASQPCGGVSVLDVHEEPCAEIFWRALDNCPVCPEDVCVPLAAIHDYTDGQAITEKDIDNRIRPLAPSTETLRQVILCTLESGAGKQGPEGPQGPQGPRGEPGTGTEGSPGPGLEAGLTQINGLSWKHNQSINPLVRVQRQQHEPDRGIVISFTNPDPNIPKPINVTTQIDHHVFQVLIERPEQDGMICRCQVSGTVIPVEPEFDDPPNNHHIKGARESANPANGIAIIFTDERARQQVENAREVWVRLLGDFVIDVNEKAIDAEFVRAELPTGDRPKGSRLGIQGGLFESWYFE